MGSDIFDRLPKIYTTYLQILEKTLKMRHSDSFV